MSHIAYDYSRWAPTVSMNVSEAKANISTLSTFLAPHEQNMHDPEMTPEQQAEAGAICDAINTVIAALETHIIISDEWEVQARPR